MTSDDEHTADLAGQSRGRGRGRAAALAPELLRDRSDGRLNYFSTQSKLAVRSWNAGGGAKNT
eukprot:1899784-Alexandrium_andersonii.AAC.1